jgi:hypothetical protein
MEIDLKELTHPVFVAIVTVARFASSVAVPNTTAFTLVAL